MSKAREPEKPVSSETSSDDDSSSEEIESEPEKLVTSETSSDDDSSFFLWDSGSESESHKKSRKKSKANGKDKATAASASQARSTRKRAVEEVKGTKPTVTKESKNSKKAEPQTPVGFGFGFSLLAGLRFLGDSGLRPLRSTRKTAVEDAANTCNNIKDSVASKRRFVRMTERLLSGLGENIPAVGDLKLEEGEMGVKEDKEAWKKLENKEMEVLVRHFELKTQQSKLLLQIMNHIPQHLCDVQAPVRVSKVRFLLNNLITYLDSGKDTGPTGDRVNRRGDVVAFSGECSLGQSLAHREGYMKDDRLRRAAG
ncbi:hypothetical protein STAS_14355 [Striga asiatica]|uniref:Uncharacterized protein n=1 Tax=Striga asiatica TaxID=4170 RepID=A0A5A7PYS4_STRAF|nr:hypothetical protein STAS_14355 [Striga asiatica]